MHTADRVQVFGIDNTQMLDIALHPTAVALGVIDNISGHFFIAAFQIGEQEYIPASAAQHGGFNKVMAEDIATKRRFARQCWQPAMVDKRAHANDGVMAPIISGIALPEGETGSEHGAVKYCREL